MSVSQGRKDALRWKTNEFLLDWLDDSRSTTDLYDFMQEPLTETEIKVCQEHLALTIERIKEILVA